MALLITERMQMLTQLAGQLMPPPPPIRLEPNDDDDDLDWPRGSPGRASLSGHYYA